MIDLFVQSRYHINRDAIRKRTEAFLKNAGLDPKAYSVSIAIVGDRKMASLHKEYAHKLGTTPVLAFSYIQSGYNSKYHSGRRNNNKDQTEAVMLGEIVISYPQTLIYAADENKLVDSKLSEFIEHGLSNLLKAQ